MLQASIDNQLMLMVNQTITTTTNGTTVIDLDKVVSAQPAPQAYQINLDVGAATLTTGHAYTIIVQNSLNNAFTQITSEVRQIISNGNNSQANRLYVLAFSPDSRYVRLRIEVAGATPSITINKAWLSPAVIE